MEYIDVIYYINLDHRSDRKEEMLNVLTELDVPQDKIHRIPAVYVKYFGALGCTKSHILTLETFINSNSNTALIIEDDFQYKDKNAFWSNIKAAFDTKINFDIIQLAYNSSQYANIVVYKAHNTEYNFLKKAEVTITASGYIITKAFALTLLNNLKECASLQESVGHQTHEYSLDIYWNKLKPISNWYVIYPPIGFQRDSYSDIVNEYVQYRS